MDQSDTTCHCLIQGASRGLGLALTRTLLSTRENLSVFATCRNPAGATSLNELKTAFGGRLTTLALDVTSETSVVEASSRLSEGVNRLDMVLNCAGILHDQDLQPERRLSEVDPAALERYFAINSIGPLLIAKHFSRFFDRKKRVVLANLSARVGSIDDNRLGGWYGYRGSKAAQNMFTRNLAIELARKHRGIICVALHPGTVDTDLSRPFQSRVPPEKLFSADLAAGQLLKVIDDLDFTDNGGFFAWNGEKIPW